MDFTYLMPVKVYSGKGCVRSHAGVFEQWGKQALIVTGKRSARANGSLDDVCRALESVGIGWTLFDRVESNPSIESARAGAEAARESGAEFVIGIGGGSPLDAAKAIAFLAVNEVGDAELFSAGPRAGALPVVAVPTTAGTGSEVTPYAILTDTGENMKKNLSAETLFPVAAFLDASYMEALPHSVTVNTALDALSHAVEGYLSARSTDMSGFIALKSIAELGACLPLLVEGGPLDFSVREKLLFGSMLGGMVIAQTGTTVVHAMGYAFTCWKDVDHGRANAYLMPGYLKFVASENGGKTGQILDALGLKDLDGFKDLIDRLVGRAPAMTADEIERYASQAAGAKSTSNTVPVPTRKEIEELYRGSM